MQADNPIVYAYNPLHNFQCTSKLFVGVTPVIYFIIMHGINYIVEHPTNKNYPSLQKHHEVIYNKRSNMVQ